MEFFHLIKATQKSGKPDAVHWQTHKTEARANLALDVALEDAEIVTGRGQEYNKPVRTDFPVFNDLPEEGVVDFEWCKRYELGEDNRNWFPIVPVSNVSSVDETANGQESSIIQDDIKSDSTPETSPEHVREEIYADDDSVKFQLATMPFRIQLLAQLNANDRHVYHISFPERKELSALEMDMDNSYVQSLLLAVENTPEVKAYDMPTLWKLTDAIKKVFPQDKRHELNLFIQFTKTWIRTEHIDRGILTREWVEGNRITDVNRTPSGANAGGVIHSDRLTPQTSMGQEYEISLGLIARRREFDIYNPPLEVDAEANAIMNLTVSGSGDTLDEFLATRELFSSIPGGMDYSRACNVATVKTTPENLWRDRIKHREYLNRVMTETDHAHPDQLIVDIACGRSSMPMPMAGKPEPSKENVSQQMEATKNVQMEEMGGNEVQNGTPIQESADATGEVQGADETCVGTDTVVIDTGHHNSDAAPVRLFTHLMLDLETMGKKPGAPIVSMGAVFFDPITGETGGEFYRVICLESSMYFGAKPDAGTILWWLKQSSEARSAIVVDDAQGLV